MPAPGPYYEEQIASYTARLFKVRERLFLLAMLRLICFVGFCAAAYYSIPSFPFIPTTLAVLLLAGFIVLIKLYFRLGDQKALLEKLLFVNTNEQAVLNNQPNGFPDGNDQLDSDSYLDDLDIFGPRSLFHLVNRTTTTHGKARLSTLLRSPTLSN